MGTRNQSGSKPSKRAQIEPRKTPRQRRAAVTVDVILDAAARILSSEGYERFNTNRVAEIAGVSVGSLYQYFPSKEAMLSALMRRHDQNQLETFARSLQAAATAPLEQGIETLVTAFIDGHLRNLPLHSALACVPYLEGASAHQTNKAATIEAVTTWLTSKLDGVPGREVALFAFAAVQAVDGVVHAALDDRSAELKNGAIGRMLVDMLTAYLGVLRR